MVTWRYQKPMDFTPDGKPVIYGVGDCLSTDTKPTEGLYNGSVLNELDTKMVYKLDAESGTWMESPASENVASPEDVEGVLNDGE